MGEGGGRDGKSDSSGWGLGSRGKSSADEARWRLLIQTWPGGCLWRLGVSGLALGQRVEGNQRAQGVEAEGGKLAFLGSWWWPPDTSVSTWCVASTQRHSGLCEGGGRRCGHDTRASEEQWGGGDGAERLGHVCG